MPRFLIERELPGAGRLSPEELQGISHRRGPDRAALRLSAR
jgi:hypothetical protein